MRSEVKVDIMADAAGANNFEILKDGRVVLEFRDWLDEEYGPFAIETPGLIKILDSDRKLEKSFSGWLLGLSSSDKIAILEEYSQEYTYQIRVIQKGFPDRLIKIEQADGGYWTVYGTEFQPGRKMAAIVFSRPKKNPFYPQARVDEVLIVSFDLENEMIVATSKKEITLTEGCGAGISLNNNRETPTLLLVGFGPDTSKAVLELTALNIDNHQLLWTKKISIIPFPIDSAYSPPQSNLNIPFSDTTISAGFFRTTYGVKTCAFNDEGNWLLFYGMSTDPVCVDLEWMVEISHSGEVHFFKGDKSQVTQLIAGFSSIDIYFLQESRYRVSGGIKREFLGILVYEKGGELYPFYEGNMFAVKKAITPLSIKPYQGTIYIAPANPLLAGEELPPGKRPDIELIKQWSTIPGSWHRLQSENVRKRLNWMKGL